MIGSKWSVSGLCITARRENIASVRAMLDNRPGLEVQAADEASGRLVVTQECATVKEHQDGLRKIQALPGVLAAELVMHYQEGDSSHPDPTGGA